jgi:tyrosyl-tRNA synthetase
MTNKHIVDTLIERGFVQQDTGLDEIRDLLSEGPVTYYVGFDPTGDSLHVGHLVPIMAMGWLQRAGHKAIAVVGGGTARVGDPSGKSEMRQMLTTERIASNAAAMKAQLSQFLTFDDDTGRMVDNADWLCSLNYIDFLRDIGSHFSVNKMLSAESYRARLKTGLSFIEFNYQLLQAYDFLQLHKRFGCTLQLGGDDQWGNILAGTDHIRRVVQGKAHALTQPLILTSAGKKMGKTAKGAVWLDPNKLSAFDYFQYWLNVDDSDVGRFLKLYTLLSMDDIADLEALKGADVRKAKAKLAWEATALVHGADAANTAVEGAKAMVAGAASAELPTVAIDAAELSAGKRVVEIMVAAGFAKSNGAARRLIEQGGVKLDSDKVDDANAVLSQADVVLRVGKKRAARVVAIPPA